MTILNYLRIDSLAIGVVVIIVIITLVFHAKIKSVFSSYFLRLENMFSKKTKATNRDDLPSEDLEASTGELRLIGVDERTAAIIIATVSDHLKTPLSELQFKSIKLLD